MYKRVTPNLKFDLVKVEFSFTKKDVFLCIDELLWIILKLTIESLKCASHLWKKM